MNKESFTGIVDLVFFKEGKGVVGMPQILACFICCL